MQDFLDRFKPKKKQDDSNKKSNSNNNNNVLGNLLGGIGGIGGGQSTKSFSGEGKSLGGITKPGKVISIILSEPGSLGIQVEKRPGSGTAIIQSIVPNSQAEKAGLLRGDILCFEGSNGQEEILHTLFIELAKSNQRPLCFEIRRIEVKSNTKNNSIAENSSSNNSSKDTKLSAEAFSRKQAMIAAVEERERKHKIATKPVKTGFVPKTASTSTTLLRNSQQNSNSTDQIQQQLSIEPTSEESRQAIEKVKETERQTAIEFGYNPYEVNNVTAGQARNAVTTVTHGTIQTTTTPAPTTTSTGTGTTSGPTTLPTVSSPNDPGISTISDIDESLSIIPIEFNTIFESIVVSNTDHDAVLNSLTIACKLISNATTNDDSKYKKVRLSNIKIQQAIVNVHGTLDLMLFIGFQLLSDPDNTTESILIYPYTIQESYPWISHVINKIQSYCKEKP